MSPEGGLISPVPEGRRKRGFPQVDSYVADGHVALVIDRFSRCIAGWQCADDMRTVLVLDALEMALSSWIVHKGELIRGGF
ncbi:MAG TPA: hypothetical protein VFY84_10040 [Jiangellales bacterium]|nr:hypothetical protein [Jiangellales bacterium]